jgi:hypothetical protein
MKKIVFGLALCAIGLLAACTPARTQDTALRTSIAGEIYSTLTAIAPTVTVTPTITPTEVPSPTPTETPKPLPKAVVLPATLNLRDGPGTQYLGITSLKINDTLTVLGKFGNCSWLKVRTEGGVVGWVYGDPAYVQFPGDCKLVPHGSVRLATGTFIFDHRAKVGPGVLAVQNNAGQDGVIVLTDQVNTPQLAFYVRTGENYTLPRVPDGSYMVYFTLGNGWDADELKFMDVQAWRKMSQLLNFTTTGASATTWSISMQPAGGGAGKVADINSTDFPLLK